MATLRCAICLYLPGRDDPDEDDFDRGGAVTIIGGVAVCYDHIGYVDREQVRAALEAGVR